MKKTTDIIRDFTVGEKTLEEANAALKAAGVPLRLDPDKHAIRPEEADRYGLLDTGTGTLDKVEIKDGRLVNGGCGDMYARCCYKGKWYEVRGAELVEEG